MAASTPRNRAVTGAWGWGRGSRQQQCQLPCSRTFRLPFSHAHVRKRAPSHTIPRFRNQCHLQEPRSSLDTSASAAASLDACGSDIGRFSAIVYISISCTGGRGGHRRPEEGGRFVRRQQPGAHGAARAATTIAGTKARIRTCELRHQRVLLLHIAHAAPQQRGAGRGQPKQDGAAGAAGGLAAGQQVKQRGLAAAAGAHLRAQRRARGCGVRAFATPPTLRRPCPRATAIAAHVLTMAVIWPAANWPLTSSSIRGLPPRPQQPMAPGA